MTGSKGLTIVQEREPSSSILVVPGFESAGSHREGP